MREALAHLSAFDSALQRQGFALAAVFFLAFIAGFCVTHSLSLPFRVTQIGGKPPGVAVNALGPANIGKPCMYHI